MRSRPGQAPMRFPRSSGVLLHITSLPGPYGSGDFGAAAYHFIDWLSSAQQGLWQVLPLGGIGRGNSPYMSSSAFAGNVLLIDLVELGERGWLDRDELEPPQERSDRKVNFATVAPFRMSRLQLAANRFKSASAALDQADFRAFCNAQSEWLHDYALFMAVGEDCEWRDWCEWDPPLAMRKPTALAKASRIHAKRVEFWKFCQWCFFRQWRRLRDYAHSHGVDIVGDLPIFIAQQSAEVWARPELFELDGRGRPTFVAGVPPDAFTETGQRWGNPLYKWPVHRAEGYRWWIARIRRIFELVDRVRIDHFRGFESYWQIPADEPTAIHGRWVRAPGDELFRAVTRALGPLPIIAEDLGVITPRVEALRSKHGFPGMRILQFAWGGRGSEERFLPHNYAPDTVVYPGTHDNDTTVGWWRSAPEAVRHHVREYLSSDGREPGWDLIRAACASVADTAIYPMQDVLGLDGAHRMNFPGTSEGNWTWRFAWSDVNEHHSVRLAGLSRLYERSPVESLRVSAPI